MDTEVEMDDFVVTSQNADVEAVRASVAEPPAPPAADPEVPVDPDAPAEDEAPPPDPEVPAAEGQARDERGHFKSKGKASLQDRLNHTVWEREEARRQAAALQAEIEQLRRPATPPPAAAPQPEGPPPGKPQLQDYDDHNKFIDDTVQWHLQEERQRQAAVAAFQQDVAQRATFAEREQAFAATVPDYSDVMAKVANVPIPASLQQAILSSERGPALAYFLATHPEDATDLITETERLDREFNSHAVKVAPLVRRLLEKSLPASPASSGSGRGVHHQVPPPISPVGASHVVAGQTPIDLLPPDEYVEAMNAREAAERRKGRTTR